MKWICVKEWKEWQKGLEKCRSEGVIEGKLEEKQNTLKEQLEI